MSKPRLKCSFSGGKTSAFMTKRLKEEYSHIYDIIVTFTNTAREDERTLTFVHNCDVVYGFNTVWLEAVVHPDSRKGSTHRIVTYETASRNGEPFEEVIKKYGIPNMTFQPCNRELKLNAMRSYCNSIGWHTGTYDTAIGIRMDEQRRVSDDQKKLRIVYPLIDWFPSDKQDVNDWAEDQPFQLGLKEHEGNCVTCHKKSDRKLFQLIREQPSAFDWNARMEDQYAKNGANRAGESRVFFRRNRSTAALFEEAKIALSADDFEQRYAQRQHELDLDGGCSESCELYETSKP